MIGSLKRLAIWIVILSIWEGAYRARAFDPSRPDDGGWRPWIFPAPSHVADAVLNMLNIDTRFGDAVGPGWPWGETMRSRPGQTARVHNSPLVVANLISAGRLAVGFAISLVLGGVLGALMWRWKFLDELLGPLFLGLQTLPSVCWVPLGILVFGINERGILFVLVMGSFFAIAIALRDGLKTIPPIYQRAGQMLGARGWRQYWYVLLPASLPAMAGSLRQGFSFAWRSLMGAELILWTERHGLGYLLHAGREFSDVAQVVGVMLVMVLVGMAADRWAFARLQARVAARFGLG